MKENMHLFWGGPFSQWLPSKFIVDGMEYNCAEQFMMAKKAELFGDEAALKKIMKLTDPSIQKKVGRQIKGFVKEVWERIAKEIVFKANLAKFAQNEKLKNFILSTGDTIIVEASPYDIIWGIGLDQNDPDARDRTKWKGTNWLGEVLMDVRDKIREMDKEQ